MELRKINNVSFTVKDIKIGDVIPVGPDNANFLKIDKIPERLEKGFEELRSNATRYLNAPFIGDLMKQHKITMSPTLFAQLYSVMMGVRNLFPRLGCKDYSCVYFYIENPTANFSEVFENNLFRSEEFAIMAQMYLQSVGINSEYIRGQYLRYKKEDFGSLNSFIMIHEADEDFVFDPIINSISVVELTPEQKVNVQAKLLTGKRKVAFFETRNIITDQRSFYGYGDGGKVSEDTVFEKEQPVLKVPVQDLSRR